MLGEIIGARRPTTTQAVSALERRGLLLRDEKRRLVLLGAPEISLPEPAVGEAVLVASA
jgi:hypothetical protein